MDGIVTVHIDRTMPEPFTPVAAPAGWTAGSPDVAFEAWDLMSGLDHCEVAVDGGDFSEQTSPYSLPALGDGEHTVTVRAYDVAGNFREEVCTVYIDTEPPEEFQPETEPRGWTSERVSMLLRTDLTPART